jgi:hypothetical protein
MHPMATVQRSTGAETKALRQAMRLSIRAFAAHLGVNARSGNQWEARLSTITTNHFPDQETHARQLADYLRTWATGLLLKSYRGANQQKLLHIQNQFADLCGWRASWS